MREGDTLVVWKLDCLSRSLKDVLQILERVSEVGAEFRSLTEAIDTTTPAGLMMMQMVGSFAEFERAMIRERTSAGLAAARAEGRVGGRRRKLDPGKRREIAESVLSGRKSAADMARLYNVSQRPCRGLSRSIEIRHDGRKRQLAGTTNWGCPASTGRLPHVAHVGLVLFIASVGELHSVKILRLVERPRRRIALERPQGQPPRAQRPGLGEQG